MEARPARRPSPRGEGGQPSPCRLRTAGRRARARPRPRGSRGSPPTRERGGERSRNSCPHPRAVRIRGAPEGSHVQPALRLVLPRPAPFPTHAGNGAGGAADRLVTAVVERVVGQLVLEHVAPHV